MRTWLFGLILGLASTFCYAEGSQLATLKVKVSGVAELKGKVRLALEKSAQQFDEGALESVNYRGEVLEANAGELTVVFQDVPFGSYAIKVFHDVNNDGKLNKNMLGIPQENYGFSNNVRGNFGPAKFQEAKFVIESLEVLQSITLK